MQQLEFFTTNYPKMKYKVRFAKLIENGFVFEWVDMKTFPSKVAAMAFIKEKKHLSNYYSIWSDY